MTKTHFASTPDNKGQVWTRTSVREGKLFTHVAVAHYPSRPGFGGRREPPCSMCSFASSEDLARKALGQFKGAADFEVLPVRVLDKPLKSRNGRAIE